MNREHEYEPKSAGTEPITSGLAQRVGLATKGVFEAAIRTREIADRLFGSMPEAVHDDAKEPKAGGLLGDLKQSIERLEDGLTQLHHQIGRLSDL